MTDKITNEIIRQMNKLIVISAPSGAGKTTLCRKLFTDFPELRLSISTTTRAPRGAEKEGVEYFFVTKETFQEKIKNDGFAEWAEVHGNYYGTSKEFISSTFSEGRSVLLDIDVQGAETLKRLYPEQSLLIFIEPPSIAELERRLRGRGTESEESIQKRMKNSLQEIANSSFFDQRVVNDSIDEAYFQLASIVSHSVRGKLYASH